MTESTDELVINFSITADSAPIVHRYMMASPPQLRRRRMSRMMPMACETVLRTLHLGGKMYSGGKLNPAEFASEGLDDPRWVSTQFILNIYPNITPFLYSALEEKTSDQVKTILTTCLETYLLTVGATTSQADEIQSLPSPFEHLGQVSMDTNAGDIATGKTDQHAGAYVDSGEKSGDRTNSIDPTPSTESVQNEKSTKPQVGSTDEAASSENTDIHEDKENPEIHDDQKRVLEKMRGKGVAT